MCSKEEQLTVIPYSTIIKVFINRNIIILSGTKCCSKHLSCLDDKLVDIQCNFEETEMTGEEATKLLEKMREEYLKIQAQLDDSAGN